MSVEQIVKFNFRPIGKAIKDARNKQGMSREHAAYIVGISEEYLKRLENGGRVPRLAVFFKLIETFNLSADKFIYYDNYTGHTIKSPARRKTETMVHTLSERQLDNVYSYISALRKYDAIKEEPEEPEKEIEEVDKVDETEAAEEIEAAEDIKIVGEKVIR